jgi:glycosyltransferase involved in cell wall biosynthesis
MAMATTASNVRQLSNCANMFVNVKCKIYTVKCKSIKFVPKTKKLPVQPSAAIVILNWNGKKFLEQFLPSVLASTYSNKKVIVADNASSDDSLQFLAAHYPQVQIISNPVNEGFAKGYNTALKQVKSDYYILLNSDVEVTPGWMEPVIELMEADSAIAACQPKMLSYHKKSHFEYAGACGGWIDNFGYPFSCSLLLGQWRCAVYKISCVSPVGRT